MSVAPIEEHPVTFTQIVSEWAELPKSVSNSAARRSWLPTLGAPEGLKREDDGTVKVVPPRRWFAACRAWVNGSGPAPETFPEFDALLASLDRFTHRVAQAHLHCARAACLAQSLALVEPETPLRLRGDTTETVQALLDAAWQALVALTMASIPDVTLDTPPDTTDLAVKGFEQYWLHDTVSASAVADLAFEMLVPQLGTSLPASLAMVRDLTAELLGRPRQPQCRQKLLGLLVQRQRNQERGQERQEHKHEEGVVAEVTLEWIPQGHGLLYAAPALAFVQCDKEFREAEANAQVCVQEHLGVWPQGWDVRWSIRRRDGQALPLVFEGDSLGLLWTLGTAVLAVQE